MRIVGQRHRVEDTKRFDGGRRRKTARDECGGISDGNSAATGGGAGERGRRRTRQDQISPGQSIAGEIADLKIRTERRKLLSSAGPVFRKSEPFQSAIQPFDLMSRRHPLSSTRAIRSPEGSRDVPASSRRQFLKEARLLLLGDLAGLLSSLLHCALRLLCLLSFLGHVALRL